MPSVNVVKLIHYFIDRGEYELLRDLENALNETFLEGINAMRDIEKNHELYKSGVGSDEKIGVGIDLPALVTKIIKDNE